MSDPLGRAGALSCLIPPMLRNRYFRGKFLDEGDLTSEQAYFLERHRLRGRMNGWGVVSGLDVEQHDDDRRVRVKRGLAIDRCGREVALLGNVDVDLPPAQKEEIYFVCLRHAEIGSHPVPSLDSDAYGEESLTEDNCITESSWYGVVPADELPVGLWREPGGKTVMSAKKRPSERDAGYPIPLARLVLKRSPPPTDGKGTPITDGRDQGQSQKNQRTSVTVEIDCVGRPVLALNAQALTRIVETSWCHGETVSSEDVPQWDGTLRARIERPLHAKCPVDDMVFGVTAVSPDGTIRRLFSDPGKPVIDENRQNLVFHLPSELLRENAPDNLIGYTILVSIACDFLIDDNGNPVDGDHLGGRLPTGNGVAGGRFESWFKIAPTSAGTENERAAKGVQGEKQ